MNAGKLDQRIEIRQKVVTKSAENGSVASVDYVTTAVVFASLAKSGIVRTEEAGELFDDFHSEFWIRYMVKAEKDWHVIHLDTGIEYAIIGVMPIRRDMKKLICERVNK